MPRILVRGGRGARHPGEHHARLRSFLPVSPGEVENGVWLRRRQADRGPDREREARMTEADRKWLERQGELKKQSLLWEQWPPERIAFFKAYWSVALKWYIPFAVMLLFLMYAGCGEP